MDGSPTKDLMTHNKAVVGIGTQPDEERMQGDGDYRNNRLIQSLINKGIMISKMKDQKQTL